MQKTDLASHVETGCGCARAVDPNEGKRLEEGHR